MAIYALRIQNTLVAQIWIHFSFSCDYHALIAQIELNSDSVKPRQE